MPVTTLGRLLVRSVLPLKYKKYADNLLTKQQVLKLTTLLAKLNPEEYIDILQGLNAIGLRSVSLYGKDTTITLDDIDAGALVKNAVNHLQLITRSIINRKDLTLSLKLQKIIDLGYKYSQKIRLLSLLDAKRRKTGIANQIASGSRGNATQLMQLIAGDMMLKDAKNRDIPYIALMPYASGDSPMSYYVSAMSSRKSTYDTQAATGQVGYLSKQATNITHATPISTFDCGTTTTGIKVPAFDSLNVGAVLLKPFKGHKAGAIVTLLMLSLADLNDYMILRSPTTCRAHNGVCALCSGLQESGRFPTIGSYVALNAAKSFTEPLTQAGISCLHPGTPVRMADWSVKPIKDIKVGDLVIGSDKQGNCRPVKVTNVFDNGMQPMYRTVLGIGKSRKLTLLIISTQTHKFILSNKNLKNFKLLPIGDGVGKKALLARSINTKDIRKVHLPLAFLLGFLCGDGCYSKGVKGLVHFSCADKSLVLYLLQYVDQFGMYVHLCAGQKIYYSIGKKLRSSKKSLIKLKLMLYGMDGKYAWLKTLPNNFRLWDLWSIKQFISGLVTADGHLGIHSRGTNKTFRFNIGSTSVLLLKQVVLCLLTFCCIHGIHISESSYKGKHTLYLLQVSGIALIYNILNWILPKGIKSTTKKLMLETILTIYGDALLNYTILAKVLSQEYVGYHKAIDIEVDHPDHLFLLRNSLIISNSKHGSGMGGSKIVNPDGLDQPTGFLSVLRMFSAPLVFPGGAILALIDGRVNQIKAAPQGGHYITVGNNTVYASSSRTVSVKVGDIVLAGDTLTNGVPNPALVVHYKGLGAGRQYFTDKMYKLLKESGAGTHRRNVEQFTRAFLNKVRITDLDGFAGYYPGDIANYDDVVNNWLPRDNAKSMLLSKAVGSYLLLPIMHYTIGTKVTPTVVKKLKLMNINTGLVNSLPPPFLSVFVRSRQFTLLDKNWLPRLAGLRLKLTLFDAARSNITDQFDGPSFINKVVLDPYKPTN